LVLAMSAVAEEPTGFAEFPWVKGTQTVCSARCRAAVWRQSRANRDREVRELLKRAMELLG